MLGCLDWPHSRIGRILGLVALSDWLYSSIGHMLGCLDWSHSRIGHIQGLVTC